MARTISIAALFVCGAFLFVVRANASDAVAAKTDSIAAARMTMEEFSAQSRVIYRRVPRRVRIYGAPLSPNAQRVCNAYYVQEYRPSGTVIVPRMNCYWSG